MSKAKELRDMSDEQLDLTVKEAVDFDAPSLRTLVAHYDAG